MREIRFRAWSPSEKRMHEVPDLLELCRNANYDYGFPLDLVFMQWTGLKDRNGREIYEGDLVRWAIGFSNDQILPVSLGVSPNGENYQFWMVGHLHNYWSGRDVEVVGNIYENPEMVSHG